MRRALAAMVLAGCSSSIVPSDGAAPLGVDVIGSWHECNASVSYRADGTVHAVLHRQGCAADGTWTLDGDWLDTAYEAGSCGEASTLRRRAVRTERGLILVDPETGETAHLADDATPHGLFVLEAIEGGAPRSTTASVVGDPETTFGSGCYWSTDGGCGGLFSCSGSILVWSVTPDRFSAATGCSGGCPCGSVVEGGVNEDGSMFGDYRGVNCERSFEGQLTARRLE